MASREFGPVDAVSLVEKILKLDEARARNRWGSPQNMARTILMTDTTLQFLFHPNVFCNPEVEAVRILDLLVDAASATDRKDALKECFPIYVFESRNIGKVHPPLPEIPEILDRFWEAAMSHYRKVYRIREPKKTSGQSDTECKPRTLKSLVRLVIENERQKKVAAAAAEKNNSKPLTGDLSEPIKDLAREKSDCDELTQSRRAVTWDIFVNKMTAGFKRPAKSSNNLTVPINMDGGRSADVSRIGSLARANSEIQRLEIQQRIEIRQTVETDPSYREPQNKLPPMKEAIETSLADLDGASDEPDGPYIEDQLAQPNKSQTSNPKHTSQQPTLDVPDVPYVALSRMRLVKDGSLEAFVSIDDGP